MEAGGPLKAIGIIPARWQAMRLPGKPLAEIAGRPMIDPHAIDALVAPFLSEPELSMTTLATPIRVPEEIDDPSVVKVVIDRRGYALYFSRYPVPYHRDAVTGSSGGRLKHLGLYGYRAGFLQAYSRMEP